MQELRNAKTSVMFTLNKLNLQLTTLGILRQITKKKTLPLGLVYYYVYRFWALNPYPNYFIYQSKQWFMSYGLCNFDVMAKVN